MKKAKRKIVGGLIICGLLMGAPSTALASTYSLDGSLTKSCQVGSEAYLTIGAKSGDTFLKQQSFEVVYKYQDKETKLMVSNQNADEIKLPIRDDKQETVLVNVSWRDPDGKTEQWSSACNFVKNISSNGLSPGDEGFVEGGSNNLSQAEQLKKAMNAARIKSPSITPAEITPPVMFPTTITTENTPVNIDLSLPKQYSDKANVQLSSNFAGATSNYVFTFKAKKDVPSLKDVDGLFFDTGGAGEFQYKVGDEITALINGVNAAGRVAEVKPNTLRLKLDKSYEILPASEVKVTLSVTNEKTGLYHTDMQYIQGNQKTSFQRNSDIMLTAPVKVGLAAKKPVKIQGLFKWLFLLVFIVFMFVIEVIYKSRGRKRR